MTSHHTVIVGGGFAGVAAARHLERSSNVTLIAAENFLLFTPMLAEVAAADIEPRHIAGPLRQLCPKSTVVVGEVRAIDTRSRRVSVGVGPEVIETEGDALVLAPGSVPETFGIPGVSEWGLPFKTIADALRVRRRVGVLLERAAVTPDPALTSVAIIGGGFSGAELAAGLADFTSTAGSRYYPTAPPARVLLIDALERVTPMLPPKLSDAAAEALRRRGVELVLGRRVERVDASGVYLEGGELIVSATVVWTAGVKPSPLVAMSGLDTEPRGRIAVDAWMRAAPGVFALGDSAAVPDGRGGLSDPTAQFALRQGTWLGKHLQAIVNGAEVPPFRYRSKGQLVSLGHRNAVGLVLGIRVSGFLAWFLWRSYYLLQLPTLLRKTRVALDWTFDILFPPDIAGIPSGDTGPPS
jgi:NADH dehydrogenase